MTADTIVIRVRAPSLASRERGDGAVVRVLVTWALALFAFTMAGRLVSGDGEAMFQTTNALLRRGGLAIEARPETAPGRDGRTYSKYGLGQSVVQAPFVGAGLAYGAIAGSAEAGDRAARFLVGLANGIVTAGTVGVLWIVARDAGAGLGAATLIAVIAAATTLLAPYARADFAEPVQGLALLVAAGAGLRAARAALAIGPLPQPLPRTAGEGGHAPVTVWAALSGTAVAVAFLTKAASVVVAPAVLLPVVVAAWRIARHRQRNRGGNLAGLAASLVRIGLATGAPVAAAGALQAALNWYRFGNPFEFGYGDEPATGFSTPVIEGIGYLLWSSGKGLAWFAPPAIVGAAGLAWLARTRPLLAATAAAAFTCQLLYFARWWAWHGDWSWGPRYLHVTVPFLMLGWLAPALAWSSLPRYARAAVALVAAPAIVAGLAANVLAVTIDYGAYYSVVGNQLGRGIDVRHARVVPEFSPLRGHAWLLQASLAAGPGGSRSATNPFRHQYPWATSHPELVPEAPERAYGFDVWWAARRGRDRFLDYWSGLIAAWLALASGRLGARLWHLARAAPDGTTAARSLG